MKARIIGLIAIAVGLGFGWFFGLAPLEEARAGAKEIELSGKAFFVAPMFLVGGLALLLGGTPVWEAFNGPPEGRQQQIITWATVAVVLAAGGLGWWWMNTQLTALGYG